MNSYTVATLGHQNQVQMISERKCNRNLTNIINPTALRMAKTLWSFGHSDCNRVKECSGLPKYQINPIQISSLKQYTLYQQFVIVFLKQHPLSISSGLPQQFVIVFLKQNQLPPIHLFEMNPQQELHAAKMKPCRCMHCLVKLVVHTFTTSETCIFISFFFFLPTYNYIPFECF